MSNQTNQEENNREGKGKWELKQTQGSKDNISSINEQIPTKTKID